MRVKEPHGAEYLTADTRGWALGSVRVYVKDNDVMFVTKGTGPFGTADQFLAICPQCGDAFWYRVAEPIPLTGKRGECCCPALAAAMEAQEPGPVAPEPQLIPATEAP